MNDDGESVWEQDGAKPVHCHYCGRKWAVDLLIYNYSNDPLPWWCSETCKVKDIERGLRWLLDDDEAPF